LRSATSSSYGFFAEVVGEKVSAHGHRSLEVEFFDGEPRTGMARDQVPARYAKKLVGRDAEERVRALLGERGRDVPSAEIRALLREGARALRRELVAAKGVPSLGPA
jgi:hypothetical protein